jgi:ABC-type uncharacterized transport system permease subunit
MSDNKIKYAAVVVACIVSVAGFKMLKSSAETEAEQVQVKIGKAPRASIVPKPQTPEQAAALANRPVSFSASPAADGGTPIINSDGRMNMEFVQVAVPGPFGKVEFVKGTDKRAIEYLEKVKEQESQVIVDNGPLDVDVGSVPNKANFNGLVGRRVKMAGAK